MIVLGMGASLITTLILAAVFLQLDIELGRKSAPARIF